jgi:hypothetical protein
MRLSPSPCLWSYSQKYLFTGVWDSNGSLCRRYYHAVSSVGTRLSDGRWKAGCAHRYLVQQRRCSLFFRCFMHWLIVRVFVSGLVWSSVTLPYVNTKHRKHGRCSSGSSINNFLTPIYLFVVERQSILCGRDCMLLASAKFMIAHFFAWILEVLTICPALRYSMKNTRKRNTINIVCTVYFRLWLSDLKQNILGAHNVYMHVTYAHLCTIVTKLHKST